MEGLKKCCQCFWCCQAACMAAQCIDCWWSARAQGMCTVNCDSCCWTFCAPVCMTCGLGDKTVAGESCMKALKYCGFSCLLCCVAPLDGCYNGFMVSKQSCADGIRRFKDITEHSAYFGKRVYSAIGLPEDNEPYQTMETTFRDPGPPA